MLKELISFMCDRLASRAEPITGPDGQQTVIVPKDHCLHPLPGHREPKPHLIREHVACDDPSSLIRYVNRFPNAKEAMLIKSDADARRMIAILDYHKEGAPDHCRHTAQWAMVLSDEFAPWTSTSPLTHEQLVEFIDKNSRVIVSPDSADIAKMLEQIEVIATGSKLSMVARHGERSAICVKASAEVQAKDSEGTVIQPIREIAIKCPVSQGGAPRVIKVRVLWSVRNGLTAKLCVEEVERILREEFVVGEMAIASALGAEKIIRVSL